LRPFGLHILARIVYSARHCQKHQK
jgi:hypothetical protein